MLLNLNIFFQMSMLLLCPQRFVVSCYHLTGYNRYYPCASSIHTL